MKKIDTAQARLKYEAETALTLKTHWLRSQVLARQLENLMIKQFPHMSENAIHQHCFGAVEALYRNLILQAYLEQTGSID